MYSDRPKTPSGKSPKGSVSILSSNNRLQLRFRFAGKRHYVSLGLPDTEVNRKLASMKAQQIELDILSGNFDESLEKYKPQSAFSTTEMDITPTVTPNLAFLWERFIEYKQPQCSPNTMKYMYGVYTNYLEKLRTYAVTSLNAIYSVEIPPTPLDKGGGGR